MTRHSENAAPRKVSAVIGSALAMLFAAGCGSSGTAASNDQTVGDSYQELAGDLAKCAQTARSCLNDAKGVQTKEKACFDQANTCRDAARASDEALRTALAACVKEAEQCRAGKADGGGDAAQCREELRACIAKNLPAPPPRPSGSPPGLPSGFPPGLPSGFPPAPSGLPSGFPPAPSGLPSGFPPAPSGLPSGFPPAPSGLPSGFPPVPSGLPSGLPPPGRPPITLPPCLEALNKCVQGGGKVPECVSQARECIMKELMPGAPKGP